MYDPKFSVKQMYSNYGSSFKSNTINNANKQAADSMRSAGVSGLGSRPTINFNRDDDSSGADNNPNRDAMETRSTVDKLYDKAATLLRNFGANEPDDVIVDGKRVYQGPAFRGYDPTTRIGDFGGEYGKKRYLFGIPKLGEVTPRSPTPPTLPPAADNPSLNMFGVRRGAFRTPDPMTLPDTMDQDIPETSAALAGIPRALAKAATVPTPPTTEEDYIIQVGDTLSEIAQDRGTTVEVLQEMNNIPDKDKDDIFAGDKLKVPPKLTATQAALRRGFDRDKDTQGVETAMVGQGMTGVINDAVDAGLTYLDRFFGNPPDTGSYDEMPSIYSKAVNTIIRDLEKVEGTKPHIGSDWDNVTLALGIVPDSGLKINGDVVPADRAARGKWLKKNRYVNALGQPTLKFRFADVDTSGAVKNGIKRSDFNNDEEWSKAVINNFEQAPREAFKDYDTLSTDEQKALIDTAWNMGKASFEYSGVQSLLNEAAKPAEERDRVEILEIAKHNTQGGKAMRGLVRRRVMVANQFIADPSQKIVNIRQTSDANGTSYTLIDGNGQAVKTIRVKSKRHKGSPDGMISVETGESIAETDSLRPPIRPKGLGAK